MAALASSWALNPAQAKPRISAHRHLQKPLAKNQSLSLKREQIRLGPGLLETPGLPGQMGGTGVLERPGYDRSLPVSPTPKADEGGEMGKLRDKRGSGGGERYKVLLLDHEKHTESQVTAVLPKVVPSVTPEEAKRCFHQSRLKGAGLVTVAVKEHAEFYAQMMIRSGLRSAIEPDGDVI